MSSPTWSRTRTALVLALAIATAAACIKTSHAQEQSQGYEQMAETLGEIMTRVQAIENQTKDFKESVLEEIRALKEIVVCNKTDNIGKKASRQFAIDLVPRRRKDNSESILMMENSQKESDISHWIKSLNEMIHSYEGHDNGFHMKECNEVNPANPEIEACILNDYWLGSHCGKEEAWGYNMKSPCIIVEMNKILNWVPDVYTNIEELPTDMPKDLKMHIVHYAQVNGGRVPQMLWLNCKGQTSEDDEYIGHIEYTPWRGFPAYYFPYIGNDGYLAPIVAVRFDAPAKNVLINIECRVYSKNIIHSRYDSDDYNSVVGVMNFELFID